MDRVVDIEKLIVLIYEHRCLWDLKEKNYYNRDLCRVKWEKISQQMDTNVGAVKNKWRGLRDTFRKEVNKIPKKRSGDEGGVIQESSWPYFKAMMFLKDQFKSRKIDGNVPSGTERVEEEIAEGTSEEALENEVSDMSSMDRNERSSEVLTEVLTQVNTGRTENVQNEQKKRKRANTTALQKLIDIENNTLQEWKKKRVEDKNEQDGDFHFMMSLLPFLRKVPKEQKLLVRTKLQQILCEEEALRNNDSNFPTYSCNN